MVFSPKVLRIKVPFWPQWLVTGEVFLLALMAGTTTGWLVMYVGNLNRENPPFEVTTEQITWIASLIFLSRPIGIIAGTVIANCYGSKVSLYVAGFYYVFAWPILIFASSIYFVFLSLLFCGISTGTYFCIYPIFVSEIADRRIRGALGTLVMHGYVVGTLIGNLMGTYLEPWVYATINLAPTTIYLITFYFFPHTPYHLINCNKMAEAEKSVRFYNRDLDAKKELESLTKFLQANPRLSTLEALRRLNTPLNLKVTAIVNVLNSFSHFSGMFAILEYLQVIFTNAKVDVIYPSTLVTLMSVISVPACWLAIGISEAFGRTSLVFSSFIIFSLSFLSWGVNFHFISQGVSVPEMQWLVIISALLFRVGINIGFFATVPTIMCELYAPDVKNLGSGISHIISALCIFITSKNFQFLVSSLGYHYLFYIFALLNLVLAIFTKTCVPETKGKTLQEIQQMLTNT